MTPRHLNTREAPFLQQLLLGELQLGLAELQGRAEHICWLLLHFLVLLCELLSHSGRASAEKILNVFHWAQLRAFCLEMPPGDQERSRLSLVRAVFYCYIKGISSFSSLEFKGTLIQLVHVDDLWWVSGHILKSGFRIDC